MDSEVYLHKIKRDTYSVNKIQHLLQVWSGRMVPTKVKMLVHTYWNQRY